MALTFLFGPPLLSVVLLVLYRVARARGHPDAGCLLVAAVAVGIVAAVFFGTIVLIMVSLGFSGWAH